jgi:hypothetical protein
MSDGFLGRWSRRKLDATQGNPEAQEAAPLAPPPVARTDEATAQASSAALDSNLPQAPEAAAEVPVPTLEDVKTLTSESDFSRFAARNVAPEVKNAALRKLFSDPRYNVMDGMDVYVGDYSQPDPIAPELLRQVAGARFLRLFDESERTDEQAAHETRDDADKHAARSVAHCDPAPLAEPQQLPHADPDLRLQQDHADPGADPGHGAG